MAKRTPLVVGADGLAQQLQTGDTTGINAKFTASATLPAVTLAGATVTLNVVAVVVGDALAAGEDITVQPTAALPGGLNIAWWFVSAANTVMLGLASTVTLSVGASPVAFRVTAHR